MKHELMQLPFEMTALEPVISAETLTYHHGKHHAGYVNKLNTLIEGTEFDSMSLEQIILNAEGAVFNNAAQVYNHDFYWKGLSPVRSAPSVELTQMIEAEFESMENFKTAFLNSGAALFGSGWVWLVISPEKKLKITATSNADTPIVHQETPLMTCDVWEHAYYVDYRNARPDYLEKWWSLINWNFVSDNLAESLNDPIEGYAQPCNDNTPLCDYVDTMQANEHVPS